MKARSLREFCGLSIAVGLLVVCVFAAETSQAATKYWIGSNGVGADGSWNTTTYWSSGTLPASADTAIIGSSSSAAATAICTILTGNTGATGGLTLGDAATNNGTLNVYGTLTASNTAINIGNNGTGTLNIYSGGTVNLTVSTSTIPVKLGTGATGSGTINLYSGGTFSVSRAAGMTLGYLGISGSTGYVNQTGGSFTTSVGPLAIENGAYGLSGGTLYTAGIQSVGTIKTATFTQSGSSTNTFVNGLNVGVSGGTGTYTLLSGSLLGWQLNGATTPPFFSINVGAAGSTGTFYMGDATGTGTIGETGTGTRQVGMVIRADSAASGTFRGWGTVGLGGNLVNNGVVIADGYGTDRTLNMSTFAPVANTNANNTILNTGGQGWFAQNHGKLVLPAMTISADNTYNWGGFEMVNSIGMTFSGAISSGSLAVSLLSSDRADVPAGLIKPIGVWQFNQGALTFDSASMTFCYDNALATTVGLLPANFGLFGYDGTAWNLIPTNPADTVNDLLTTTSTLPSFYQDFAIAQAPSVPEPATLTIFLAGMGLVAYKRRTKKAL